MKDKGLGNTGAGCWHYHLHLFNILTVVLFKFVHQRKTGEKRLSIHIYSNGFWAQPGRTTASFLFSFNYLLTHSLQKRDLAHSSAKK